MKRLITIIALLAVTLTAQAQNTDSALYKSEVEKAEVFLQADGGKIAAKSAMEHIRKAESISGRTSYTEYLRGLARAKRREIWR